MRDSVAGVRRSSLIGGQRWLIEHIGMYGREEVARIKDLGLVLDTARASKFPLPLAATAHQMFMQASTAGFAKEDDSAVIKIFPGITLPEARELKA